MIIGAAAISTRGRSGSSGPVVTQYNAFGFNGSDKFISLADNATLNVTTVTSVSRVYLDSSFSNNGAIIGQFGNSGQRSWYVRISSDQTIRATFVSDGSTVGAGNLLSGSTVLNLDQWYFIAFVLDGSTVKIYLDDQEEASVSYSSGLFNSSADFRVGARNATDGMEFYGSLAECMVFDRALNSTELETIYNDGVPMDYGNLPASITDDCIIAYEMTSNDNSLDDLSGNSNDGTANGSVTSDGELIDWEL